MLEVLADLSSLSQASLAHASSPWSVCQALVECVGLCRPLCCDGPRGPPPQHQPRQHPPPSVTCPTALFGIKKIHISNMRLHRGVEMFSTCSFSHSCPGMVGTWDTSGWNWGQTPPEQPAPAGDEGPGSRSARRRLQHEAAR